MSAPAYSLDELRKKRPRYLVVLLTLYGLLSSIIAFLQLFAIEIKWLKIPSCFAKTTDGPYFTIRKIWLARMLRRSLSLLLRTPLRNGNMALINFQLILPQESGCIITICHTPWARLLAEWCRVNNFALVLVGGPWIKRTKRVNIPGGGIIGLRRLVHHLRSGGRVIVIGDNIGRSRCCSINFLGKECMASILPARLALLAGVPLLAVTPQLKNGMVTIQNGITLEFQVIRDKPNEAIQSIFKFFEDEILLSPSIWAPYILQSLNHMSSYTPRK
jgi:hypothetical protein